MWIWINGTRSIRIRILSKDAYPIQLYWLSLRLMQFLFGFPLSISHLVMRGVQTTINHNQEGDEQKDTMGCGVSKEDGATQAKAQTKGKSPRHKSDQVLLSVTTQSESTTNHGISTYRDLDTRSRRLPSEACMLATFSVISLGESTTREGTKQKKPSSTVIATQSTEGVAPQDMPIPAITVDDSTKAVSGGSEVDVPVEEPKAVEDMPTSSVLGASGLEPVDQSTFTVASDTTALSEVDPPLLPMHLATFTAATSNGDGRRSTPQQDDASLGSFYKEEHLLLAPWTST